MQQKYHSFDIFVIIISVIYLLLALTVVDHITVNCLKRAKDIQLSKIHDITAPRHTLPAYNPRISDMLAYYLDENNYYIHHPLLKIPKIHMFFLVVYNFIVLIVIPMFILICIMVLTRYIMKLTGCLEQEI